MSHVLIARRRASGVLLVALAAALALVLAIAGNAKAASPITAFYAGSVAQGSPCNPTGTGVVPSATADTFSDFCIAYSTLTSPPAPSTADDLKRQVIDTPKGFAGFAGDYPSCTDAQFAVDDIATISCPADSQVGAASADIRTQATSSRGTTLNLTIPPVPGQVYNLTHSANEAARLGIILRPEVLGVQPFVKVLVRITLRPSPDVGLRSIIDNLPSRAKIKLPGVAAIQDQPLAVDNFSLTFWGAAGHVVAQTKPFAFLGSDCSTDQTTHDSAVSYDGTPTSADAAPYRLTGCDDAAIPFAPSVTFTTGEDRPDEVTASTVKVGFAPSANPAYVASSVKKVTVVLPPGLSLSGQIASGPDGLPLCTSAQFAQTSASTNGCAANTAVGDVILRSPALSDPLLGQAYLGAQPSLHALPDLYIEAQLGPADDAPRVKLVAHLTIDSQNRIVTTLDDLPDLPVSSFELTFRGGDHSALVTPPQCGTFTGELHAFATVRPATSTDRTSDYSVSSDCDAVKAFAPTVGFSLDNPASAGKSSPLTTSLVRPDRSPRLAHVELDLPAGQLATLTGVPECGAADAAAGTCPESTRVGSITAFAGVGPQPFAAPGAVYLTSRASGDVAGLSLHVPVKFGDVDLGALDVPGRVQIRGNDLGLRVIADVPQRYNGIPLNLRRLDIRLDRPNFALSPSNCRPQTTTSSVTDDAGDVVRVPSSAFQLSGCDKLAFRPSLDAAVTGQTSPNGRPNVQVRITNAAGSSGLGQAFVTLPQGLGVDTKQIDPRACSLGDFQATRCAPAAIIGKASGALSITDEPLAGEVYLLKVPGQVLPGIGLAFKGRFAGNVQGTTAVDKKTGQLQTNFASIPDLPITALQIDITGGANGILVATAALCQGTSTNFVGKFVAQSGPIVSQLKSTSCGTPLGAKGARLSAALRALAKGKPTLAVTLTAPITDGQQLKISSFDVVLPTGYALIASKAKSTKGAAVQKLSLKGAAKTAAVGKSTLRVTLPAAGSTAATLRTRTGTIAVASKSLRKSSAPVLVVIKVAYVGGATATIPVSLPPH